MDVSINNDGGKENRLPLQLLNLPVNDNRPISTPRQLGTMSFKPSPCRLAEKKGRDVEHLAEVMRRRRERCTGWESAPVASKSDARAGQGGKDADAMPGGKTLFADENARPHCEQPCAARVPGALYTPRASGGSPQSQQAASPQVGRKPNSTSRSEMQSCRTSSQVTDDAQSAQFDLLKLSKRLHALTDHPPPSTTCGSLAEALLACESALPQLEQQARSFADVRRRAERAEVEAVAAKSALQAAQAETLNFLTSLTPTSPEGEFAAASAVQGNVGGEDVDDFLGRACAKEAAGRQGESSSSDARSAEGSRRDTSACGPVVEMLNFSERLKELAWSLQAQLPAQTSKVCEIGVKIQEPLAEREELRSGCAGRDELMHGLEVSPGSFATVAVDKLVRAEALARRAEELERSATAQSEAFEAVCVERDQSKRELELAQQQALTLAREQSQSASQAEALEAVCTERDGLRQELLLAREDIERSIARQTDALEAVCAERDGLREELELAREDQDHSTTRQTEALEVALSELDTLRQELEESRCMIRTLAEETEQSAIKQRAASSERDEKINELELSRDTAVARAEELERSLTAQSEAFEAVCVERDQSMRELELAQQQTLTLTQEQPFNARQDAEALEVVCAERDGLRQELNLAREEFGAHVRQTDTVEAVRAERVELRQELQRAREDQEYSATRQTEALDVALTERDVLRQELEVSRGMIATLTVEVEQIATEERAASTKRDDKMNELELSRDKALTRAEEFERSATAQSQAFNAVCVERDQYMRELELAQQQALTLAQEQAQNAGQDAEALEVVCGERDGLRQELQCAREDQEHSTTRQTEALDAALAERDALRQQLEVSSGMIATLAEETEQSATKPPRAASSERDDEIIELELSRDDIDEALARHEELERSVTAQSEAFEAVCVERDQSMRGLEQALTPAQEQAQHATEESEVLEFVSTECDGLLQGVTFRRQHFEISTPACDAAFQQFEISTPDPTSTRCSSTLQAETLEFVRAERDALARELQTQRKAFMRELAAARAADAKTTLLDSRPLPDAIPVSELKELAMSPVATRRQAAEEQSHLSASPAMTLWEQLEEAERRRASGLDEVAQEVRAKDEELRLLQDEMKGLRELALDAANFKGDCEALEVDNNNLRERLKMFEVDLEGPADDRKGHANHRQKIQYLVKLKEENEYWRSELAKKRHELMRAEMGKKSYAMSNGSFTSCVSFDSSRCAPSGTPSGTPAASPSGGRVAAHLRRKSRQ